MPVSKSNLTQVPVNADTFNLTGDLGTMAESITSVVSVANQTAGDTVATTRAAAGFAVSDARPLFCWDQSQNAIIVKGTSGWRGGIKPSGHMGKTDTFQALTGSPAVVTMAAAGTLRGGMTFDNANDALVVPLSGYYRINGQFYTSGTGSGTQLGFVYLNGVTQTGISCRMYKAGGDDTVGHFSGFMQLTISDKVSLWAQGTANVSCWGAGQYSGCYLEVEYMDQW